MALSVVGSVGRMVPLTRKTSCARPVIGIFCGVLCVIAWPNLLLGWPGHDWNGWANVTAWTKPILQTDQVGRSELCPLLGAKSGSASRIDGIRAWEKKRASITHVIQQILGKPTDWGASTTATSSSPVVQVEVLGEETLVDHVRRHIRIRSEPDDWIPAWLLLPADIGDDSLPAMICVHQTVSQGKDEPCGISGSEELVLALELVRRGFVCIAPDMIGFGERIPRGSQPYTDSIAFYRRHPQWSFMGKMIWDLSRVVDYLETLPFVDPLQIGSIGHSHGAYTTLLATAFEPRISLAVASCGFTTFRQDPHPERWSHMTPLIPQLGTYLPDVMAIPFDWHHVCSLIAPRPLLVWYGLNDHIFPNTDNLADMFEDVRSVYGLYGAADDLAWHAFDGGHGFPEFGRRLAYDWVAERLFPVGDLDKVPADVSVWEAKRPRIRSVIRRTIGRPVVDVRSNDVKHLDVKLMEGYERRLVEYEADENERVRAYLCVPESAGSRLAGVLVLHQTAAEGKREAVGMAGDASLAFARDLAQRGYITFAPDSIAAGERIDRFGAFDTRGFYLRHPNVSAMGKMLYDAQRALDVLLAMPVPIDPDRIGVIGHSLGAEEALMLAAFDERIKATIASCGYATFEADANPLRWARDEWFSYMPKLRPVFARGRLPHWDWDDVLRLISPRSVYQHTTREDQIFPDSHSAYLAGESARAAWSLYGRSDQLVNVLKPGKHQISDETRREMYDWLDHQIRKPGKGDMP